MRLKTVNNLIGNFDACLMTSLKNEDSDDNVELATKPVGLIELTTTVLSVLEFVFFKLYVLDNDTRCTDFQSLEFSFQSYN
jgi:hypothetical protein